MELESYMFLGVTLTQSGDSDAGFDSSGKNGYCVIFDGTDDEVTITAETAYGVAPFSITAWIYLNNNNERPRI